MRTDKAVGTCPIAGSSPTSISILKKCGRLRPEGSKRARRLRQIRANVHDRDEHIFSNRINMLKESQGVNLRTHVTFAIFLRKATNLVGPPGLEPGTGRL